MSDPERANLLNAERAGDLFGVTPMRVRQLVTEGVLPRPIELGNRLGVWHYADVTAVKAAREGLPASRPLGLLDAPERPLEVHHDAVLNVPSRWDADATRPVHVRVWAGATQQGRRVVVLLGQMPDGPTTLGQLREIAAQPGHIPGCLTRPVGRHRLKLRGPRCRWPPLAPSWPSGRCGCWSTRLASGWTTC